MNLQETFGSLAFIDAMMRRRLTGENFRRFALSGLYMFTAFFRVKNN